MEVLCKYTASNSYKVRDARGVHFLIPMEGRGAQEVRRPLGGTSWRYMNWARTEKFREQLRSMDLSKITEDKRSHYF